MDLLRFRQEVEAERLAWRRVHELATQLHQAAHRLRSQGGDTPYDAVITTLWVDLLRMDDIYPEHPVAVMQTGTIELGNRSVLRPAHRNPIANKTRLAVYKRDGYKCLRCGTDDNLTLDHIQPWSKGGSDDPENLQTLCMPCNVAKGDSVA